VFGPVIDYWLLRPLTHSRNKASEEELSRQALASTFTIEEARKYVQRARGEYFAGAFPVSEELSYLDVGCGMGRFVLGLSALGAKDVTGVDILQRHIDEARTLADKLPEGCVRPELHHADVHNWDTDRQFDVVIVLGAMEHIHDPRDFLKSLARLIKPGGRAFVSFEPFQGPFGDHMSSFFRVPIPWRGLIFNEKAVMRLRAENYRPTDPATRYQEIAGGLNCIGFRAYFRYIREAGLEVEATYCNPQFGNRRRWLPLSWTSAVLTRIPYLGGYFVFSAYSILRRSSPAENASAGAMTAKRSKR
jgi:2-polyprenyl-3-methyl-5-hydroxy-6-metoxy-1,4-benzoquinol methylase